MARLKPLQKTLELCHNEGILLADKGSKMSFPFKTITMIAMMIFLTACASTSRKPNYHYNSNGYGGVSVPVGNKTRVSVPIGKSHGKVKISSPNASIRL